MYGYLTFKKCWKFYLVGIACAAGYVDDPTGVDEIGHQRVGNMSIGNIRNSRTGGGQERKSEVSDCKIHEKDCVSWGSTGQSSPHDPLSGAMTSVYSAPLAQDPTT